MVQGPDKGRAYQGLESVAVIGRSSEQVQLSDTSASRRHAEIRPEDGHWVLVDLESANGTFLNGRRVGDPLPLQNGDQIRVGNTLLVFSTNDKIFRLGPTDLSGTMKFDTSSENDASILTAVDATRDSAVLQPLASEEAIAAWNVVFKIAEAIGTIETVDAFLERVADVLFDQLIVDHLVMLMIEQESGSLVPMLARTSESGAGSRLKSWVSPSVIRHVIETRDGVLSANAATDNQTVEGEKQDTFHRLGLRSMLCVPIVARGQVHGVLHLACSMSRHTYTREQLRLVVAVGRLTGMAIENAQLLENRMRTARLAAVGETVAFLSHHIRNILQGMQGGAEVVELGFRKRNLETAEGGWVLVRRNLDRTLHLAMNMLTFSKDRQPRIEPGDLNRVVEEAIALVLHRAQEKNVSILSQLGTFPHVPMDADGMHQVVQNLLVNAIEAVPHKSGEIRVRTFWDVARDEVFIEVTDNGPGIPVSERSRIFDVFQSSKGHGGTGLGLAAANKIITELSGRIEVDCPPLGGTTFRVAIPMMQSSSVLEGRTAIG